MAAKASKMICKGSHKCFLLETHLEFTNLNPRNITPTFREAQKKNNSFFFKFWYNIEMRNCKSYQGALISW